MLRTSRNDHDVAGAADPLFAAEAELHLSLEHPHDLLICVIVRLDMDAGPDAWSPAGLALRPIIAEVDGRIGRVHEMGFYPKKVP